MHIYQETNQFLQKQAFEIKPVAIAVRRCTRTKPKNLRRVGQASYS